MTLVRIILWVVAAICGVFGALMWLFILTGSGNAKPLGWVLGFGFPLVALITGYGAYSLGGGSTRPCPRCGKGVKRGLVVCPTCGFDFNDLLPTSRSAMPPPAPPAPPAQ
jgi:hypothetical protein